ncbi:response regulator [Christiangramia aquimixticola]|uniref:response regulator n=1 Tax=Christiangramia aquimixticola TaxID=1697558 RepID=UPI003AA7FDB5
MSRLLLIEDDVTVRENTAELLELSNYQIITAPNGRAGIEIARKELPDLIICDIMMPEVDGYGVLKVLSQDPETANIPFIFLSAKTEHKDIRKGMNLGADDYLTKPFEEEELIAAIESRLAKVTILKSLASEGEITRGKETANLDILKAEFEKNGIQHFKEEESIYKKGEPANLFFLIDRGVVKTHRLDDQGKILITEIYKEGDFFGNYSNNKAVFYEEDATAMENVQLYTISNEKFHQLLKANPSLALQLVDTLNNSLREVKKHLMEMAYGSVRKKTANTILLFAEKIKKHPLKSIRISRADLAGVAGMASESLIRTLSDFKKEGLIEIDGRNIILLDQEGLKAIR